MGRQGKDEYSSCSNANKIFFSVLNLCQTSQIFNWYLLLIFLSHLDELTESEERSWYIFRCSSTFAQKAPHVTESTGYEK